MKKQLLIIFYLFSLGYISVAQSTTGCPWTLQVPQNNYYTPCETNCQQGAWIRRNINTNNSMIDIDVVGECTAYAVGLNNTILRTTDNGSTWTSLNSGINANTAFGTVKFIDNNNGFVLGNNNAVLRTSNGGNTWVNIAPPAINASSRWNNMWIFDPNNIIIVGDAGLNTPTLARTTDGGANWQFIQTGALSTIYGVFFTDNNTGFISTNYGNILKTIDGGNTWTTQLNQPQNNNSPQIGSIYFTTPNNGFAVGGRENHVGRVYQTIDAGTTWTLVNVNSAQDDYYTHVEFENASTGYITGGNIARNSSIIFRTTDGGATWGLVPTNFNRLVRGSFNNVNSQYVVGLNGTIIKLCQGNQVRIQAKGAQSYIWSTGSTSDIIAVSPSQTTTYTVSGTADGCTQSEVITINVSALSVNSVTSCAGETVVLSAQGGSNFIWSNGSTAQSITVTENSSTSYTVSALFGCCRQSAVANVLIQNVLPNVVIDSKTICNGNSVNLIASGAINYGWSPATGLNTTSGATVIANPTETTTYTVTGNNACGSDIKTVTVTVINTPTISVMSDVKTICKGGNSTLTAFGATNYTWSPSVGLNATNGSTVIANPTITTTYTVTGSNDCGNDVKIITVVVKPTPTVFVNNPQICEGQIARLIAGGADSYTWSSGAIPTGINTATTAPTTTTTYTVTGYINGCEGTAVSTVTVKPAPVIMVNSETICTGESTTLTANGAYTYQWSTGETSNSITVSPTSTTNYTVTGWSRCCACEGNVAVAKVTVKPRPIVTASSVTVCYGETAFLEAEGADTYKWSQGITPIGINTAIGNPSATTTYTVVGDVNGCKDEAEGTITIPSISVNSAIICQGQSAVLTAQGGNNYVWSNGATTSAITVSPTSTESYTVTAVVKNCIRCNASAIATVTVKPKPNVYIVGPSEVCGPNSQVTMTAYGADSYYWVRGGGGNANPYIDYPSYDYDYQVQGTTNGCSSLSNTIRVHVKPKPRVTVSAINAGVVNRRVTANVQSGSGSGFRYQWYRSTSSAGPWTIISGATSSTYLFNRITSRYYYGVVVTNSEGCDNKISNQIPSTAVGRSTEEIEETFTLSSESIFDATVPDNEIEIVLSPNPNNGNMTLAYYIGEANQASMNIYDISGRTVASYSLDIQSGLLKINNELLTSGVYFYKVIVDNQEIKRDKIIIVK